MTLLPIAGREMRVAARRTGLYRQRFIAAITATILFGFFYIIGQRESVAPSALSQRFFYTVSLAAFLYVLTAGVHLTSDSLSQEVREGTLGLLFLTPLRGYDIVLGKLAASSLSAAYGMVAMLPILAVPLLMGGVSGATFGQVALLLLATLFFSLSFGMLVSAWCRVERRAASGALAGVLFIGGGWPILLMWAAESMPGVAFDDFWPLMLPSPGFAFAYAFRSGMQSAAVPVQFFMSVAAILGSGTLFLALASHRIPRSFQERPEGGIVQRWRAVLRRWSLGAAEGRVRQRRRWLDIHPILWLQERHRWPRVIPWLVLGLLALGYLAGLAQWGEDWLSYPVCVLAVLALHATLKIQVANAAGHGFTDARHSGLLALVLGTPLSVSEIVGGHRRALRRQFDRVAALVFALDIVFMVIALEDAGVTWNQGDWWDSFAPFLVAIVLLPIDYLVLVRVGLWQSLIRKSGVQAARWTIFLILVMPWAAFGAAMAIWGTTALSRNLPNLEQPHQAAWVWAGIGIAIDLYFGLQAACRLPDEIRSRASG